MKSKKKGREKVEVQFPLPRGRTVHFVKTLKQSKRKPSRPHLVNVSDELFLRKG